VSSKSELSHKGIAF